MKLLLSLVVGLMISQFVFAQNLQTTYLKIANSCGQDISKKIRDKEREIKDICDVQTLKIAVLPFKNEKGEITQISMELTPKIVTELQQIPHANISSFDNIQYFYADKNNPAGNSDLIMMADYSLDNQIFTLDNISLKTPDGSKQVVVENSTANVNTTNLTAVNYAFVAENIEQLSRAIVSQFGNLLGLKDVSLDNFVGSTNKLPSQFSELLMQQLESDFIALRNISVKRNISDKRSRSINSNVRYIVSGTYTEQGDKIKIISYLKDPNTQVTEGAATAYIKKSYFSNNNIDIEPANTTQVRENETVLQQTAVTDDFMIDLWTNKGNNKPIFKKGEEMELYIQANESCYVRIFDIMSDGRKALILDSYYISHDNVGKEILLGSTTCTPPFGAETLVIMASNQQFSQLNVEKDVNGLSIINDNLLETRGFPPLSNKKAEKYIYIITVK